MTCAPCGIFNVAAPRPRSTTHPAPASAGPSPLRPGPTERAVGLLQLQPVRRAARSVYNKTTSSKISILELSKPGLAGMDRPFSLHAQGSSTFALSLPRNILATATAEKGFCSGLVAVGVRDVAERPSTAPARLTCLHDGRSYNQRCPAAVNGSKAVGTCCHHNPATSALKHPASGHAGPIASSPWRSARGPPKRSLGPCRRPEQGSRTA